MEQKVIITSNPFVGTGQAYLFQALLGKEVILQKYSDDYLVIKYKNQKFTVGNVPKFWQETEVPFYDGGFDGVGETTLKIGDKLSYRKSSTNGNEWGIGKVVWFDRKLRMATVYDIYEGVYRSVKLDYNYCHKLKRVSSVDDLLGMRAHCKDLTIVDVSKSEKCIRYHNDKTGEYKRLIWYADGGLARFFHALIKLGFNIDYEPSDPEEITKTEKLFQVADSHDLDIIQREHMYAWSIVNKGDTIRKAYPMSEYLLQMFNLKINIREVEKEWLN